MDDQETELPPPRVLIFPYPAQGHVNPMLKLAELLCHAGLHVTFLVTHFTHRRLLCNSTALISRLTRYSGFRFEAIPDGLPEDDLRSGDRVMEQFRSFRVTAKPLLRELLGSDGGKDSGSGRKRASCIIADGTLSFAIDVGEEVGIPVIIFWTNSACAFWAFFCGPKLIEAGEIPFQGNNMDVAIKCVPGMDGFLRRRDLPSIYRVRDVANQDLQILLSETLQTTRARALILNTFEDLEGSVLAQIRSHCPQVYTVGPLHAHLKVRLASPSSSNSFWEEDTSCMAWLDAQSPKSVIYVSFGSIIMMAKDQLMEFLHGLVCSEKRFLLVIRPDSMMMGKDWVSHLSTEILEGTRERGCIIGWAPQEEVLGHKSIGGFITHSGWNSILESIVVGVPMICWPYFGDQHVNSRFVGEVWKLGLDMKDTCDRGIIETMIRDLMDVRREEFQHSSDQMAKLTKKVVAEGGSSYCNLDCLIKDIRSMGVD
ncbi:7-deoxyloganetic acid glucosyl transferase-like [Rhododendron vialii]|uniref:7-deoxyloganetic acid glucosyl transferase-like n=1 Tax=Rhododendron vialii TaxID=182163 RepID=UPI00265FBE70|nr:7-deoxyloganetic acid glucosyl transferase-like [Rhododendron vialii]